MTNTIRFAVAGLRHGHIFDLIAALQENPETPVVAICEEDAETRSALASRSDIKITHEQFDKMFEEVDFDAVAIGDYYGKRGSLVIKALEAGKHVIADKPICCSLEELDKIEKLATDSKLAVGCQFDLRGSGSLLTARRLILGGEIGEIHTVSFSGQHPLLVGSRPAWYFQVGCHGGTINDIAIHAMDIIPWMTGREIRGITCARVWNAKTPQFPHFQDSGQFMLKLDNQGGVMGDVSYMAPESCGYSLPQYWRFTLHGSKGMIEVLYNSKQVMVVNHSDKEPRFVAAETAIRRAYLPDFLAQAKDPRAKVSLTTDGVLHAQRLALLAQEAAEKNQTDIEV